MQCQFNGDGGCSNEGTHYPILCLPPPGIYPKSAAARSALHLATCEDCQSKVTIANFMLPEARAKIATAFIMAGRPAPDFDRAWLEWGEVNDPRWHASQQAILNTPERKPN